MLATALPVSGNTSETQPENRVFYPALDGLRTIAFLMVFADHYLGLPWGWTGVNVFFVLSGFLITGILLDSADRPHRMRDFYVRRSLRIFPLYYSVFLGLLLLDPLVHWKWSAAWLAWPLYLGNYLRFRSPAVLVAETPAERAGDAHLGSVRFPRSELYLGHFWSLCVEEQFYLLWPWLVFGIRSRKKLLWLCAIVVIVVPIARVATTHIVPRWLLEDGITNNIMPFQLDALLLGGLLAGLWRSSWRQQLLRICRAWIWVAATITILYIAATFPYGHSLHSYVYPTWTFTLGQSFANLFSGSVLVYSLQPGNLLYRLLALRPLRAFGRLTYGAYIFHDILHDLFVHMAVHSRIAFVRQHSSFSAATIALTATICLSWLSFRFLETPFLNLKERFAASKANGAFR